MRSSVMTPIFDKQGRDYSSQTKGIPQGCPVSPVLMNVFLHQLDIRIVSYIKNENRVPHISYADDMIFAIKSVADYSLFLEGGPFVLYIVRLQRTKI